MDNSEMESFITKFRCLWNSGFDAHLELDSHAGQAWVSLRVRLGHAPGPLQPHDPFPQNRPRNGNQDYAAKQEELLQEQNKVQLQKPMTLLRRTKVNLLRKTLVNM